jgi:hypothetical protein
MTDRIIVPFRGEGSGTGELTWGQRQIWRAMQETNTSQSMVAVAPLEGRTAADLAAELEFYMCRYESMRTRLHFGEGGRVTQVVSASGEIALEIVDTRGADPTRVAGELAARWGETLFDYAGEWPVRMAAIRHRGVDTHVVVTVCHLASDGMGAEVMMAELSGRDPVTGRAAAPVTAMTPRELAVQQATPAARRQSDIAVRYWERILRTIPPRRFGEPEDRPGSRYWQVTLASPATYAAIQPIAARTGGDAAPVLLAAFAVALARVTLNSPVVTQAIVSNRFRPGLADVVSPVNQTGLYVIDVADATFDEVVDRTRRATLTGMKHAYYDPEQLEEVIATVGRERGEQIDLACVYNDRRIRTRDLPAGPPPSPRQLGDAVRDAVLTWDRPLALFNEKLMVTINDVPGTIEVVAEVDTRHVAPGDLEAVLRGIESVVVEAAFDPAAPTRVPARATVT